MVVLFNAMHVICYLLWWMSLVYCKCGSLGVYAVPYTSSHCHIVSATRYTLSDETR